MLNDLKSSTGLHSGGGSPPSGRPLADPGGRALGIDYGSRRIGIAVSDPLNIIARPIGVIENNGRCFVRIRNIVQEYNIAAVVVGMPLTLRGEKKEKAKEVERFIETLAREIAVRIVTVDERLTSTAAHETLRLMGATRKQRRDKGKIDEMASAIILQTYLDQQK